MTQQPTVSSPSCSPKFRGAVHCVVQARSRAEEVARPDAVIAIYMSSNPLSQMAGGGMEGSFVTLGAEGSMIHWVLLAARPNRSTNQVSS